MFKRVGVVVSAAIVILGSLVAVRPPAARAELQHPRQQFLRDSVAGLFLHWGQRTSPAHTSCASWEADVTSGGWTPGYWVTEAQKLHAQYLVLATFHSRLGYARAWPSAIPGSCRTTRDFLGELITAASAQGLRVILYMTDDPQWWNEGLPAGQSWLNSAAYSTYKGRTVDLHTRDGFGEYSYDLFFEVIQRYPNLGGFWIDNDNAFWESHNLYEQIHTIRPNFTLSNNNEDTAEMDMISNEQKTGMTPSYDYPQAVFTAAPRLIEADFKLPSTGAWWYDGTNPTVDRKLTLGRLVTNAGSSVKALMAETAQVNGRFPSNQESFNNFADGYLDQIWSSLTGTEGGGYLHGGLKPGRWNNSAYGVTTVSKTNPNLHYVHVIDPPTSGTSLVVRDNGYRVTRVSNLRTGATLNFTQDGGNLTITGVSTWDQYDTVFRVETNGRQGIYPPSSVVMSASASASGRPASAASDGDYLTYWDSNRTTPVSLRFDLGSTKRVQYLGVNQREDSVSYARSATEQSARIRDYRVYFSSDGTTWGSPVRTGQVPSTRGVAIIDLPATNTRHVRLEVVNTWAASTDTTRFQRLRVDEAWVGSDYAGAAPAPSGRHEAEDATISQGNVEFDHAGFSGTGFVDYDNVAGGYVQWTVSGVPAGQTTLSIGYANGTTTDRPMDITVNGALVANDLSFAGTGAWTGWQTRSVVATLTSGTNTIRATAVTANGGPNVDYLDVATSYEAEQGTLSGSAVAASCSTCSGGQKVRFIGNGTANHVTIAVTVATAGDYQLTLHATVGGTRSFFVSVNGGAAVEIPMTGPDFTTVVTAPVTLTLSAGSNSVRFFNNGANAPDLDRITVG